MKKYISVLLVSSLVFIIVPILKAQDNTDKPHAIIHFVRNSSFFGAACRSEVSMHNQDNFILSLGSAINYTVYSEGEIEITLNLFCPSTRDMPAQSRAYQVVLNVSNGKEYYVLFDGKIKEVQQSEVQKLIDKSKNTMKREEDMDHPIKKAVKKAGGKAQGTCFLISANGYLVTNNHCVQDAKELTVTGIDGDFVTKYAAAVVATDPSNDLALIKITNKNLKFDAPPYSIRSSGVAQGDKIYALGFPMADDMGKEVKITDGIISAKSGAQGDISKFQISAAVNFGNSGGPLIDEEGNVVGVIYAKSSIAESAGYAVKSSYLETFLKNVEGFDYPTLVNTLKDKPFSQKVAELKKIIFIVDRN